MILRSSPSSIWHYGCGNRAGHFATPNRPPIIPHEERDVREWLQGQDGQLHDENSDRWLTHWFEAADGELMTLIARRDRSVDSRPGSWCGFLMPKQVTLKYAIEDARAAFPHLKVWSLNP